MLPNLCYHSEKEKRKLAATSRPWATLLPTWKSLPTKTGKAAEKPLSFKGLLKIWKRSADFFFFKISFSLLYFWSSIRLAHRQATVIRLWTSPFNELGSLGANETIHWEFLPSKPELHCAYAEEMAVVDTYKSIGASPISIGQYR